MSECYTGDVIRIQLSPDGSRFRYWWGSSIGLTDYGPGDEWTDALILDVRSGWSSPHIVIKFNNCKEDIVKIALPLLGHPGWEKMHKLQGFPQLSFQENLTHICPTCQREKDMGKCWWCGN